MLARELHASEATETHPQEVNSGYGQLDGGFSASAPWTFWAGSFFVAAGGGLSRAL